MKNDALINDYLNRAAARLKALEVLKQEGSHADVVRESQEALELAMKALLRAIRIEVPRVHDVSPILRENADRLPEKIRANLEELCRISRNLRRDRELAFYGSEDLTPSAFYTADDASEALTSATWAITLIRDTCLENA